MFRYGFKDIIFWCITSFESITKNAIKNFSRIRCAPTQKQEFFIKLKQIQPFLYAYNKTDFMKNIPAITLVLLCALLFSSCTTKNTLKLVTKTEYAELGRYARFSVYMVGEYMEMATEVDSVLSDKVPSWKQLSIEDHQEFTKHFKQTMINQMDNKKYVVYKSAEYHLKGVVETDHQISINITLGKPIHSYKDGEEPLTGYIKFNNDPKIDLYLWTLSLPITIEINDGSETLGELYFRRGYVLNTEEHIDDFGETIWEVKKRNNE